MIEGPIWSMVAPGAALSSALRTSASVPVAGAPALAGVAAGRVAPAGAGAAAFAACAGAAWWLCAQAVATTEASASAAAKLRERFMRRPGIRIRNSDHAGVGKVRQF